MNLNKAIQVVNYFLSKYTYKLNYTKLIKLLYIADKEALNRWDTPISKDSYCSMPQGPVLSGIYDLIMGKHSNKFHQLHWDEYFMRNQYDLVSLRKDEVLIEELSEREIKLLDEIDSKYHGWSYSKLIKHTHDKKLFPEYEDPGNSSIPLPLHEILKNLGRNEKEIAAILAEERFFDREAKYYESCCS